jgi:hypothetical protein
MILLKANHEKNIVIGEKLTARLITDHSLSSAELFFHDGLAVRAVMESIRADDKSRHLALTVIDRHHEFRRARRRFDIDLFVSDVAFVEPRFRVATVRAPGCRVDFYFRHAGSPNESLRAEKMVSESELRYFNCLSWEMISLRSPSDKSLASRRSATETT